VFKKTAPQAGRQAEVVREEFHVPPDAIRTEILEVIKEAASEVVESYSCIPAFTNANTARR
jgi:electron transfer flavoprotein alpha subunit